LSLKLSKTSSLFLKADHRELLYMQFKFFSLSILFLTILYSCKVTQNGKKEIKENKTITDTIPITFEPDPFSSLVELETSFGKMKIELFFEAGKHRENFIKLVKQGYYNGLLFHRVIQNFMLQGGDPNSRNASANKRLGDGGPGYEIDAEINSHYFHVKGALAAARSPDQVNPERKSSGSQFYIVDGGPVTDEQLDKNEREHNIVYTPEQRALYKRLGGAPQLDMNYTVFGRVYEGYPVIDSISAQPTARYDRPEKNIVMKIKVLRE
jgi:cyclophilin family peptidyl-prolyl cis-trans isomerase